jgi:phage N-6-adenine-methyltransferase
MESCEWYTPPYIFDKYNKIYNFDLDVCATALSTKCKNYFDIKQNGLEQNWIGTCWMNPPYKNANAWVRKAHTESIKNKNIIVCLLPVRTSTDYWQDIILPYAKIEYLRGRIAFGSPNGIIGTARHDSAIAVFDCSD